MSDTAERCLSLEDRCRLAVAWLRNGDGRIMCVACGGLRHPDEPPCRCLIEAGLLPATTAAADRQGRDA